MQKVLLTKVIGENDMGTVEFYKDGKYCGHLNKLKADILIEKGILTKKKNNTVVKTSEK